MSPEAIDRSQCKEKPVFESAMVSAAYDLAQNSHEGQTRKSGEPYFVHCYEVYKIIKDEFNIEDEELQIAGLLHDCPEDTSLTLKNIELQFSKETAELVSGVTKLENNTDQQTLKEVIDKTYINPKVAILKLADRLHNMRTLEYMSQRKQKKKARETLDVYARLAESLGMWKVKEELEDLSYLFIDRESYKKTLEELNTDPRLDPDFICNLTSRIDQTLTDHNISAQIEVKKSGVWALKEKQEKTALKGKGSPDSFKDINDTNSIRVKVKSINECYEAVNFLHQEFGKMVDFDRYDEFIGANKRVNGYQALQTTINTAKGPVEVAIMTKEMEEFNNWGVVSLIKENKDVKDYILKLVFTPTDSVRFLPKNATGVDFAAAINPRVLAEAESINIDGIDKPLTVVIPNASALRVNLGESRRAPLKGLEDYSLPQTRKMIQELRILEKKDILIKQGQEALEKILIPRGLLVLTDIGDSINPILYKLGCQGIDDLYFMLGNGSIKEDLINTELNSADITKEKLKLTTIRLKGDDHPGILIDVVKIISEMNKNIVHIEQKNSDGKFNVRILIDNMSKVEEDIIRQFLESDERFNEGLVV